MSNQELTTTLAFILGWEVANGEEMLAGLSPARLEPGRYILNFSSEEAALKTLFELKDREEVAVAWIKDRPEFDYLNPDQFFSHASFVMVEKTYQIRIGELGAIPQEVAKSSLVIGSPFIKEQFKNFEQLIEWNREVAAIIKDIEHSLNPDSGVTPRSKEAKVASMAYLEKNTRLSLPLVFQLKGSASSRATVAKFVSLLDNVIEKSQHKGLMAIRARMRSLLAVVEEPKVEVAEGEIIEIIMNDIS